MLLFKYQKTFSFFKEVAIAVAVVMGCCILPACSQDAEGYSEEQKSRVRVEFSAFHFDVESMGALSRGTLSEAVTRLSFAVFDADDALVDAVIHQESTADAFGTVEMELYPGEYKMVAVAHNGDADATVTSTTSVTLPGITITDTFAEVQELTVESGEDCSLDMTLPRITSAFILKLEDTPPADVEKIEVIVNSGGVEPTSLNINPGTGLASNNWQQACVLPVANLTDEIRVYFIGMLQETVVTVKATAFDADGEEIISHTISSVPLSTNHQTIATGTFFQSTGSGTFTVNSEWLEDNNINY